MRYLLPSLLLATNATIALATLKGTQFHHKETPKRLLKKEDEPIAQIIEAATSSPSQRPTALPTVTPTIHPTFTPSAFPSIESSDVPSIVPSVVFSSEPSEAATSSTAPTAQVTSSPSPAPSIIDAIVSTESPTTSPVNTVTSSTVSSPGVSSDSVSIVPLKTFRVDLVSTIRQQGDRKLTLRTASSFNSRNLKFFESTQDAQLVHLISNHVQNSLTGLQLFGDVLAVQLKVLDKVESVFGNLNDQANDTNGGAGRMLRSEQLSLVLVSYTLEGEVLLVNSAPDANQLEEAMLRSLAGEVDKSSLLKAFAASNDDVLRSITDVDATSILPLDFNEVLDTAPSPASLDNDTTQKVNIVFPILVGIAFLSTLSGIGFIIHRKYRQFRSNEYEAYQQRKQRNYNHFESPESSVTENVTPTSRDNAEQVFAYDYSVEESSSEDERGWSSASTSTDVLDWQVPFDEHSLGGARQVYEDQTKMELLMIQMGTSVEKDGDIKAGDVRSVPVSALLVDESQTDVTLDGLYSTADSYFDTTTAKSRNQRCDSIDTLNCSTDQQAFGPGWEREVDFEGILDVMDQKDLVTDVTKILLQNCVTTDDSRLGVVPQTPQPTPQDKPDQTSTQESLDSRTYKHASYKSMYTSSDPTATSKANISAGIFTQETLGMINRNRLKSTPPPSENEYDEDVVNDAKENALLGNRNVDSDEEEDVLFENVDTVSPGYGLERMG